MSSILSDSEFKEITGENVKTIKPTQNIEMNTVTCEPEEALQKIRDKHLSETQKTENSGESKSEDETSKDTPLPLQIILSRYQTKEGVQKALLQATTTLIEKKDQISGFKVPVRGFENTSIHPSMNNVAKKKYAEAVEWGLIGLMIIHGYKQSASEIYCMAYVKAQMKSKKIRFKNINPKHMEEIVTKSIEAYLDLLYVSGYKHPE